MVVVAKHKKKCPRPIERSGTTIENELAEIPPEAMETNTTRDFEDETSKCFIIHNRWDIT